MHALEMMWKMASHLTSPFLCIKVFAVICSCSASSFEELYNLRLINKTILEAIHNYSDAAWRRLIVQAETIEKPLVHGDSYVVEMALKTLIPLDYKRMMTIAIDKRNRDAIDVIVANGIVGIIDDYSNALCNAARIGDVSLISLFLDKGAKINHVDKSYSSALIHASFNGQLDAVRFLLSKRARIDLEDYTHIWPLLAALSHNHKEVAKLLITAGANVNKSARFTPLGVACDHEDVEMLEILVKAGADINSTVGDATCIERAVIGQKKQVVEKLIDLRADVRIHSSRSTLLEQACQSGNVEIAKLLLKGGADPNEKSPLVIAVKQQHKELVRVLINAGAKCNEEILELTCRQRDSEITRMIFSGHHDRTPEVSKREVVRIDEESLKQACYAGDLDVLRMFVDGGVDVKKLLEHTNIMREVAGNQAITDFLIGQGLENTEAGLDRVVRNGDIAEVKKILDRLHPARRPRIFREIFGIVLSGYTRTVNQEMLELILSYDVIKVVPMSTVHVARVETLLLLDKYGVAFGDPRCNEALFKAMSEEKNWTRLSLEAKQSKINAKC